MTEYVLSLYALDDVTIFPNTTNLWHAQICTTHVIPYVQTYILLRFDKMTSLDDVILYYPNKWLHRREKKEEAMVDLY